MFQYLLQGQHFRLHVQRLDQNLRLESLLYEYVRGEGNEEKFVNECNLEAFKEWEKVQKNAQNNTPSEEKE